MRMLPSPNSSMPVNRAYPLRPQELPLPMATLFRLVGRFCDARDSETSNS